MLHDWAVMTGEQTGVSDSSTRWQWAGEALHLYSGGGSPTGCRRLHCSSCWPDSTAADLQQVALQHTAHLSLQDGEPKLLGLDHPFAPPLSLILHIQRLKSVTPAVRQPWGLVGAEEAPLCMAAWLLSGSSLPVSTEGQQGAWSKPGGASTSLDIPAFASTLCMNRSFTQRP